MKRALYRQFLPVLPLVASLLFLGYGPTRSDSLPLLLGFGAAFIAYLWTVRRIALTWKQLFVLAVGLRLLLFMAPISWTDDHFRYIWDGLCSVNGIPPFSFTPEEMIGSRPDVFSPGLFERLNSPGFHSVYPPLAQAVFAFAAWIGKGDVWISTLVLRAVVIAFELLTIRALGTLLLKDPKRIQRVALYALNPLVILEFTVNIHTEALMIAPCLWAIIFFRREQFHASAIMIAIGASAKLWPLLFLAWVPSRLGLKNSIVFILIALALFLLSWLPLYTEDLLPHLLGSLRLYFNYLEFNGALFEGMRRVLGDALVKGSGLLSAITLLVIAVYTICLWMNKRDTWPEAMMWLLAFYLFGSQAVHPWYILPLLAFAVLTDRRWPILWSLLIAPTYLNYAVDPYAQPYWYIAVEYALLGAFIVWELRSLRSVARSTAGHSVLPGS